MAASRNDRPRWPGAAQGTARRRPRACSRSRRRKCLRALARRSRCRRWGRPRRPEAEGRAQRKESRPVSHLLAGIKSSFMRAMRLLGDPQSFARIGGGRLQIAAQDAERRALQIDLALRTDAAAAEDRQRRTPALQRVLKQESRDYGRKSEPAPVHGKSEPERHQDEGCGVRFQRPLDVPFAVEFFKPSCDGGKPRAATRASLRRSRARCAH